MKTRDTMMNDVIAKFGIENEYTIDFCAEAENFNNTIFGVEQHYNYLMNMSLFEEE